MNSYDTIVAIATARGEGAISIVRMSGELAFTYALQLTKRENLIPRYATLSNIYALENGKLIDEVIVIYFQAPFSFSGEDIIEFQCHGGISIASIILEELLKCGAQIAQPGEFSKRAFLNNKIDATKAEAIAQLIQSKSKSSTYAITRQLNGDLQRYVDDIRNELIATLAHSEVAIDYAEEDLPKNITTSIMNQLQNILTNLNKIIEGSIKRDGIIHGFKIAIIGKPNVGKSSLLNALLNSHRAIVSDIPGTTRDTIEAEIKIGTHIATIIDTAGIHNTNEKIEQIGIAKSKQALQEANIIIALFDGSEALDKNDQDILNIIEQANPECIFYVINKIDLIQKIQSNKIPNSISISCKRDVALLLDSIQNKLDKIASYDEITLISKRQIQCTQEASQSIHNALEYLKSTQLEFFSYHIKESLFHLSSITHPFENSEMLDSMFGNFCLGK